MNQSSSPPFPFGFPARSRAGQSPDESPDDGRGIDADDDLDAFDPEALAADDDLDAFDPEALAADDDLDGLDSEAPAVGGREGLPSDFRMRHDAHYVEHITRKTAAPPIHLLPIGEIDAARLDPSDDLQPLVDSVVEFGVLHPLLVRRRDSRFALVAGARRLAAALKAGLTTVPCLVHDVDDDAARALAAADNLHRSRPRLGKETTATTQRLLVAGASQFSDSVNTLATCLGLIPEQGRPLKEQVAVNLMRAEARRAAWQARAYAVLANATPVVPVKIGAASMLEAVTDAVRSDPRLSGTALAVVSPNGAAPAVADRDLVSLGATGLLLGLVLALRSHGVASPAIEARARTSGGLLWLDLVERQTAIGAEALDGAGGDDAWSWPGGPEAVIGLATAQRVASLHGGRLEAVAVEPRGCRLSLGIPHTR